MIVLLILNAAAAAFAAIFSIVAAFRPQIVPPNQDDRGPFLYAYTGRAVGLALLAIPVLLAGASPLAALAALALGLAQAGDAVAGLRVRSRQLAIGASLAALVHVASAVVIALTVM
jgi:hypothetical protein